MNSHEGTIFVHHFCLHYKKSTSSRFARGCLVFSPISRFPQRSTESCTRISSHLTRIISLLFIPLTLLPPKYIAYIPRNSKKDAEWPSVYCMFFLFLFYASVLDSEILNFCVLVFFIIIIWPLNIYWKACASDVVAKLWFFRQERKMLSHSHTIMYPHFPRDLSNV